MPEFEVIDNRTGGYPDCEKIALTEEWAKHLIYCDIDCFAITEDGDLILIDDCNNVAYPPSDRFTVKVDPESLRAEGQGCEYCNDPHPARDCVLPNGLERILVAQDDGTFIGKPFVYHRKIKYCPYCGARMEG